MLCISNGVFATNYTHKNYISEDPVMWNDNGDTLRHTLWNYGMVCDVGYEFAKRWSDAHEYGVPNNPVLEMQMDLFNNNVGLQLGVNYPFTILHSTFVSKSKMKVHNGYCKIISGNSLINSRSYGEK